MTNIHAVRAGRSAEATCCTHAAAFTLATPSSNLAGLCYTARRFEYIAGCLPLLLWLPATGDCTYGAVHKLNHQHVHPVVHSLVKTAFFRYFKVGSCDLTSTTGSVPPRQVPPESRLHACNP